jgi:hypothetical protein
MTGKIESISDLIDAIRGEKEKSPKIIWFRGQSDAKWPLIPGLFRKDIKISEGTLLSRFKQSAAMLVGTRPSNDFDWIFLMQHYGVPSRLLDWSENPLVALYFALHDDQNLKSDADASIWMLRPSDLNTHAHINDKSEGDYIPSFDDDEVSGYSTVRVRQDQRMQLYPIATIATRNNPRIQAQLGAFTIHHNYKSPIEDIGNGKHCMKYIIPNDSKSRLIDELSLLGMNRFSLFPEMDSIGKILKELF